MNQHIEKSIQLALVALVVYWSFLIFQPFVMVTMWAMILAVALYPLFTKLKKILNGKSSLSATMISLLLIVLIIIPVFRFGGRLINSIGNLKTNLDEGTLEIPPPDTSVKDWPLLGDRIYEAWHQFSVNLEIAIQNYSDEISNALQWLFNALGTIVSDVFISLFAIIIAGVLMHYSGSAYKAMVQLFTKLAGEKGESYVTTSRDTIKSVVKGLILIAIIQGVLAGAGLAVVGVPAAGIWAIIVVILSIIQLPVILLMIPLIVYVFSIAETWVAVIFAVYMIIVGILDNFLKPVLLGKGLSIPMPVILIGAIGGMILHGILGLFVGPVVLAIGWQLYKAWLGSKDEPVNEAVADV